MARVKKIISSDELEPINRAIAPPELNEAGFDASDIQVVRPDRMETKIKEEKFMNERVEIMIEPGLEANDPMYVDLRHNGITQMVKRGEPQIVKRKFLYVALMGKKVAMNCMFGKDSSGNEFNRLTPSTSGALRAALLRDNNTERGGMKWVQSVMAESTGIRA